MATGRSIMMRTIRLSELGRNFHPFAFRRIEPIAKNELIIAARPSSKPALPHQERT